MQAQQELRSVSFADISNRAENKSKRISFTSISTDITCTDFKSPSAIKPCFFRSPAPGLRQTQCENTFFPDSRAGKRPAGHARAVHGARRALRRGCSQRQPQPCQRQVAEV